MSLNKVILLGRLTRDPEVRMSQGAEPMAIARYTLAVDRKFKRDGEPTADFFNCVAFSGQAKFAESWMKKGGQFVICGRLQTRNYEKDGQKVYITEVIVDEQCFADGKKSDSEQQPSLKIEEHPAADVDISEDKDDLPF